MPRLDEGCVQADCFSNLLLNKIISVAPDLKVVLNLGLHCYDGLSNGHYRLLCLLINA